MDASTIENTETRYSIETQASLDLIGDYDLDRVSIATLASHSSLQIVHGAKKEGLSTVLVVERNRLWFYQQFKHLIDKYVIVDKWRDLCREDVMRQLAESNSILVPHGSFVEYVGLDCAEKIGVPIFGLREIFRIEASQYEKMKLLRDAGIPTPRIYGVVEPFDKPVIVKLPGAKGGKGYFIEVDYRRVVEKLEKLKESGVISDIREAIVQEYIVGVTSYVHYFNSPVLGRLEITGADIRYESDIDGVRRIPAWLSSYTSLDPTFTVVGNIPLVLRESILVKYLDYGYRFVEATRRIRETGIIGPFCLESIIDKDMNIWVFEFSGRIVAGTNIYIDGSPYSYLYWDEPMSVGRRIAREIKLAIEKNMLEKIVT